jgi:hypothetical protein
VAGAIARVWGIAGVVGLLAQAIVRLTPRAVEALKSELDTMQWITLVLWCAFMVHAEGYKGFHRRFSPRVVARAWTLAEHPRTWQVVFAPAFCMSLVHASRRGLAVAWCVLLGVVALVAFVSRMSQPWRGIIDAGVVLGLALGLLSILYFTVRAATGSPPPVDPDLPKP